MTSGPAYTAPATAYYYYNSADDLTSYTDDAGNTTTYSYDNLDRLVNETDPANGSGQNPQTNWTYDAMGNVTQQSDLQAVVDSGTNYIWETTNYTYNGVGELTEVQAPGPDNSATQAVTKYAYTPTGQVLRSRMPTAA